MDNHMSTSFLLLLQLIPALNCEEDWHFQGPNVALGKRATQSPGTYDPHTADLAVDGNSDTRLIIRNNLGHYQHNQCTHTNAHYKNKPASWTVNLDRLRDFTVTGLPAPGAAELLYDDRTSQPQLYRETIINITVTSQTPFRRMTVAIPARPHGFSFLTLCEVEIYAEKPCPNLPDVPHARYININHQYYPGDSEWLTCDTGYLPKTYQLLTCTHSSTWQPPQPFCSPITCPHPGPLAHGYYTKQLHVSQPYTSGHVDVGMSVIVSCSAGYTPSVTVITCTNSSTWSTPQPSCSLITCPHPGTLEHGRYTYSRDQPYTDRNVLVGTSLIVLCLGEYKPSVASIRCTQTGYDGRWDKQAVCKLTTCQALDATRLKGGKYNYNTSAMTSQEYDYGTVAEATCLPNFRFDGENQLRTCGASGTWTGTSGDCVLEPVTQHDAEKQTMPIAVIVGTGAGGVLLGVVLVVIIILVYRRRLQHHRDSTGEGAQANRPQPAPHEMETVVNTSLNLPVAGDNEQAARPDSFEQHTYETIPDKENENTEKVDTERGIQQHHSVAGEGSPETQTATYVNTSLTIPLENEYEQPSRPDVSQQHTYESLQEQHYENVELVDTGKRQA